MSDTCGPTYGTPFAFYDPDTCSLRTSEATLLSDSTPSSPTLPPSGIACGGRFYELPTSAPPTGGNGSSGLLPTPTASYVDPGDIDRWEERRQEVLARRQNGNGFGTPLGVAVRLLPTPRATDGTKGGPNQRGGKGDLMLPSAVHRLLPTPVAHDDGKTPEAHMAMKARMKGGPRKAITSLSVLARAGFRQPDTGANSPPPSDGGNTSSDAPPPTPSTNADGSTPTSPSG